MNGEDGEGGDGVGDETGDRFEGEGRVLGSAAENAETVNVEEEEKV